MRILGIDPGTTRIGYGLIDSQTLKALAFGLLEINAKSNHQKLFDLEYEYKKIIEKYNPDLVAIENIYFSKNQKTAIAVSEARGVLKITSLKAGLKVMEYGPKEVKLAVTGYGLSDKKAVYKMICKILGLKEIKGPDDIADALAIATTAAMRYKFDSLSN